MRTETINVYRFSELTEKAQQKALTDNRGILIDGDWWRDVYEDAEATALLEITGFDLDYKGSIDTEFMSDAKSSALSIVSEHGESTATYSIAKKFLSDLEELERSGEDADTQPLEDDFIEALGREYFRMLEDTYEDFSSDEAIGEHMEANDYEFTEDGRRWRS